MTLEILPLPSDLRWIKLVCRLGVLTHDGVDPDDKPDLLPTVGTLRLSVTPSRVKVREADGRWRSVAMDERQYMIRADGELVDKEGRVGVWVLDPMSTLLDPVGISISAIVMPEVGERWGVTIGGEQPNVVDLVSSSTVTPIPASSLPGVHARLASIEGLLASGEIGGSGSGIRNVYGTVALDTLPGIYEVYALDAAIVEGVALAAGDAAVFRYLAGSWSWMVVGQHTTWQSDTQAPTAPTIDSATPGHASIAVTFSGGTDDTYVTRYRVRVTGGPWSPDQPVGTPSYLITGLTPSTEYTVEVQAGDAAGNWSASATQAITTAPALDEFNTLVFYDSFDRTPVGPNYSFMDPGNNVADSLHEWTGTAGILNGTRFVGNVAGAVTFTNVTGTGMGPYINHGVPAATAMQLTAQVTLVANTAGSARITPRNETATTVNGLWLAVTREATRDYLQIGTAGGFIGTIDYNLNNGVANWAHIPGADYALTRTLDLRAILTDRKITVWVDDAKVMEGTRTDPLTAAPFLEAAKTGVQVSSIRLETP